MPDPIFLGRLALALRMPVSELGTRMSAWELNVFWPAYFQWEATAREREESKGR